MWGFLGVGVGGGRGGAFLADSAEAEDEEEEARERRRQAAGEGRQNVAGLVVGRRRWREEAAGGHSGNFVGGELMCTTHNIVMRAAKMEQLIEGERERERELCLL